MPAAVDDYAVAIVLGLPIGVTNIVDSDDLASASLTVEKVDCFPDGVAPDIGGDTERRSLNITGDDGVGTGRLQIGKIHHGKFPQFTG